MNILPLLRDEFEQEAAITRTFLERVPADRFDWKPHEKSMSLKELSVHLAEIPAWAQMALETDELDFESSGYEPTPVSDSNELMALFESSVRKGSEALEEAEEEDLLPDWTMRNGEQVLMTLNKYEVIRHGLNQTTHHRAQLGVCFRLLDIPVPKSYGPTADDQSF